MYCYGIWHCRHWPVPIDSLRTPGHSDLGVDFGPVVQLYKKYVRSRAPTRYRTAAGELSSAKPPLHRMIHPQAFTLTATAGDRGSRRGSRFLCTHAARRREAKAIARRQPFGVRPVWRSTCMVFDVCGSSFALRRAWQSQDPRLRAQRPRATKGITRSPNGFEMATAMRWERLYRAELRGWCQDRP